MKYIKYILGIIVLLILLFIAKGFITPSISYSSEIFVDKPVKEAMAVMNDESKIHQWLKGITNIEHISGEKGTVGAVTKYTFNENGEESIVVETIESISPNEHISMSFVMEGVMNMNYEIDFNKKDGKTHIQSSTIAQGDGMIMKSMISFMKDTMQTQEDENMNNLKKLIEENETNYFPIPEVESVENLQE